MNLEQHWADGLYNDEHLKQELIHDMKIVHKTDGTIDFDDSVADTFVQFLAQANEDQGIQWEPNTTEEQKIETCTRVVCNFLSLVAASNHHLPKFSIN